MAELAVMWLPGTRKGFWEALSFQQYLLLSKALLNPTNKWDLEQKKATSNQDKLV